MNAERMLSVLTTLARSFTDRDELAVLWGANACTDFTRITLSAREDIVPGVECSRGESWLSKKASLAHEAGHLIFTDVNVWLDNCGKGQLRLTILNIVEDARIELAMANLFPGALRWFRFSNEYVFLKRDWEKMNPPDRALMALCGYGLVGRIPDTVVEAENEADFVLECAPLVDGARLAATTGEASRVVDAIVDSFLRHFGSHEPDGSLPDHLGTSEPRRAPRGPHDPRRKPVLKKKPEASEADKPKSSEEQPREERPGEQSEEKPEEQSEEKPEEPETEEPSRSDGSEDSSEEVPGNSEEDSVENDDACPEEDAEEESGEFSGDDPDEAEEHENEASVDESSAGDPEGDPGGEGAGEGDDSSDSGASESENDASSGETGTDTSGGDGADSSAMEEDLLSDMDSLIEESEAETKAFHAPPPEPKVPEADPEDVEKAVSVGMHKDRKLYYRDLDPDLLRRAEMQNRLHATARRTTEQIRKILEGKRRSPRRNLQKGRLDSSALWKTSFSDPGVFLRLDQPSPMADLVFYLLLDSSYSMTEMTAGRSRIEHTADAGMLMHMVCKQLSIAHASAGFTTRRLPGLEPVVHYKVKSFAERDGKFERLADPDWYECHMVNNVDGYSIRTAASEIALRPEEKRVIFVVSDGNPCAAGYEKERGIRDTIAAVRETEKRGIAVIGMYIGPESPVPKRIYNNLIILSAGNLPSVIARMLKKIITA